MKKLLTISVCIIAFCVFAQRQSSRVRIIQTGTNTINTLQPGTGISVIPINPTTPSTPAEVSPTNLPDGFVATGWWEPSRGYATNGGNATLSNLTSIGSFYNLTNPGTTKPIRQVAELNSLDTLYFSGSTIHLDAIGYTNFSPFEVFIVASITNIGTTDMFGSFDGVNPVSFRLNSLGFNISQGATVPVCRQLTNRYAVFNLVFSNSNSTIFTNNVQGVVGNSGTTLTFNGLKLGVRFDNNIGSRFSLASMFVFTNQLLSSSARLAAYQYCTNRFGIVP